MPRLSISVVRFVFIVWLLGPSQFLLGQSDSTTSPPRTMSNHHQIAITGCLKRGSGNDEYHLTDQNGKTWELVSEKVNLAEQVFRVVTITGKETVTSEAPPSQDKAAAGEETKSNDPLHFTLRVITLKVLSRSCTR